MQTILIRKYGWLFALLMLFSTSAIQSQDWLDNTPGFEDQGLNLEPQENVTFETYFKIKPDTRLGKIYLEASVAPGRHIYSVTQKAGGPTRSTMTFEASEDFKQIGPWVPDSPPHTKYEKEFKMDVEYHEDVVIWSAPIEFSDGVDTKAYEIEFKFGGLTCNDDGCLPENHTLTAEFDGDEKDKIVRGEVRNKSFEVRKPKLVETPEQLAELAALYDVNEKVKYEKLDGSSGQVSFLTALFGAFVGGILLNLMPCVFPVLGLKVLGFVEQAGNEPKKIKMHGIAFAFGIIFSMWVLAGVILGIKIIGGQEVNWGEQMGNSYFVGAIVIVLFVFGLNLAGVFEMGLFLTRVGGTGEKKEGYGGSFFSGILTTLVATPCSGPFLGAAMGYTLAQPPAIALFMFTIFGLGIALPYLVLSFFPSLINMLPRPGAWMETFKKLMAFALFAAAAFFIKSFGTQTGVGGLGWLLMAICVISLAFFFYGKWSPAYVKKGTRLAWGIVAPAVIAGVGVWMYLDAAKQVAPELAATDDGWELWVPGKVQQKLADNQAVWVDYTADW